MRVATAALAGAILVALVCLAIAPARHWTQEQVVCRGAAAVYRGEKYITAFGQSPDRYGILCTYRSGRIKGVSQGNAVLGGIGLSLLLGVIGGALAGSVLRRR